MCRYHHFSTEYAPCNSEGVPWRDSNRAPIFSAETSALSQVSTAKDFCTDFFRVRSTFRFLYVGRQWSSLAPIIRKNPAEIHFGLGARLSGGGGLFIAFKAWNFVSVRFKVPVSDSANGEARSPRRYPLWHRLVRHSNCARRGKWSDAKFQGSQMPIVLNIRRCDPRT